VYTPGVRRSSFLFNKILLIKKKGFLKLNVSFIRATHDWEVDVLTSFFTLLYSHRVRWEGQDKLWWGPSHKWMFDISSFYNVLAFKDAFPFL
jgi:hypothetical protein